VDQDNFERHFAPTGIEELIAYLIATTPEGMVRQFVEAGDDANLFIPVRAVRSVEGSAVEESP